MIGFLKQLASVPLAAFLLIYEAVEALFRRLVLPAIAALARAPVFIELGRAIAALPPYAILILLLAPFAAIEPFKYIGLYWLAEGRLLLGAVTTVAAHLASILICERIFHVGRAKLLTIGWFARGYFFLTGLRDEALAWIRATRVWRASGALLRRVRHRLRLLVRA